MRQSRIPPEDILLTAPQQEACELLSDGLTTTEIAARLKISRAGVLGRFKGGLKKLGIEEMTRRYPGQGVQSRITQCLKTNPDLFVHNTAEVRKARKDIARREETITKAKELHEQALELGGEAQLADDLDAAEAMQKLMIVAKKSGMPAAVVDALANRVLRGLANPPTLPEGFKDEDLRSELHEKIRMVLAHMDMATIGGAKLQDLSGALKTLQEQVLLLDGRPTQILGVDDMENLSGIAARMQAEMDRRNKIKTIEGECSEE